MGITNGLANIMSIIAPLLVGFIVTDVSNASEWRYVFFISAGIYFFGNLIFVIFSSTDIQVWNDSEHHDRREFHFVFIDFFSPLNVRCSDCISKFKTVKSFIWVILFHFMLLQKSKRTSIDEEAAVWKHKVVSKPPLSVERI